jgi:hypothetical protein
VYPEIEVSERPVYPNAWPVPSDQDVRLTLLGEVLTALADVFDWSNGHAVEPGEPVSPLALAEVLKQAARDIEEFTNPDA